MCVCVCVCVCVCTVALDRCQGGPLGCSDTLDDLEDGCNNNNNNNNNKIKCPLSQCNMLDSNIRPVFGWFVL